MIEPPLTKKSLGQHWLFDVNTLTEIAETAEITDNDQILEIGPGVGTLTEILLTYGAKVTAIELDKSLYNQLKREAANLFHQDAARLTLINDDILKFDLTTLPDDYKVVANIPYYLTSHLLRLLSESSNPPSLCVLLVQKEVAQRVAAKPGSMSLLSVTAQYFWQVRLCGVVPAKLFTPPPKIDSQIMILARRPQPLFPDIDSKQFFRLVKAGFSARRKTLENSLSAGLQITKEQAREILTKAEIKPTTRSQEISLDDWYRLYQVWV